MRENSESDIFEFFFYIINRITLMLFLFENNNNGILKIILTYVTV